MTWLVALIIVLIVAIFMIGMVLYSLMGQHTRSQYTVDGLALQVAKKINPDDRVGQINHLEARSRELVYLSRDAVNSCGEQRLANLAPLCEMLMSEANAGHDLVENERKNQIKTVTDEIRKEVATYNRSVSDKSNFRFPWLKTYEPKVIQVNVGYMDGVESNVPATTVLNELYYHDRRRKYVADKSNLFKSNINAKLASPDESLDFKFCPLPAYVSKTSAAPRNANPDKFKSYGSVIIDETAVPYKFDQIPTAVQLITEMGVAVNPEQKELSSIAVGSIGITNGALSNFE